MRQRVTTSLGLTLAISLAVCFRAGAASSSEIDGQVDLYRVIIASRSDAELLQRTDVDVFFKVPDGYLVLATDRGRDRLAAAGLEFRHIAADVDRHHLALDMRHDSSNVGRYPIVFREGSLRIYRVDRAELIGARGTGLAPIRTENIPVVFPTPPLLDKSISIPSDDLDSLINRVSEDSLLSYIEYLQSFDGRVTATNGNLYSSFWLKNKFIDFGYDSVFTDTFTQNIDNEPVKCRNVIACKPGTEFPYYHIIIGAHRDAGDDSPGADDNGSGTSGVLEIARALAGIETKYTIVFILFDAEEQGLHGSWHYAAQAAAGNDRIMLMFNMDMIGHFENDPEANLYHNDGAGIFAQTWSALADSISSIHITAHLDGSGAGGGSDDAPFVAYGYDAVFLQEYIFSTVFHTPGDSTTYINFDYMTRMVMASLATVYVVDRQLVPEYELYVSSPDSLPILLIPNLPNPINVRILEYGGARLVPGSAQLHYAVNGGDMITVPLLDSENDLYSANLPGVSCLDRIVYFISVEDDSLGILYLPPAGEAVNAVSATGLYCFFEDNFSTDKGWTVSGDAHKGHWERGVLNSPWLTKDYDLNQWCYATAIGGLIDVDEGKTCLMSPPIEDIPIPDALIGYARWYSNQSGGEPHTDVFNVYISGDNGQNWVLAETVGPVEQATGEWFENWFWASEFVAPSADIRLQFEASDYGEDTYIKAAVDAVKFYTFSTDLRVITETLPAWTIGIPFSYQLLAAACDTCLTWTDRFGQLEGTGLALSTDGLLSGIPNRAGPVVFRALVTDQFGESDEQSLSLQVYDSLRITSGLVPQATIGESYSFKLGSTGGTGDKTWSDQNDGLAGSGITLDPDGLLAGTPDTVGELAFIARVTDAVGAWAEKSCTLSVLGPYTCGDANADRTVNVGDAVYIINYVFKSGPAPDPPGAGDANCDGAINVGDAVYLINYIFKDGQPPCCPDAE